MSEEKIYRFWLHSLPGVGDGTIRKLLVRFGSGEEIYRAGAGAFREVLGEKRTQKIMEFQKSFQLQKAYEEMLSNNISFYTVEDEEYPFRLRELTQPPYGLYCLGKLPENDCPAVAVIGARECSEYGSYMAKAFAGRLAGAGVSVISGMARGIDGIGQRAALAGDGKTYAVLGCGVDICYPASNRGLYREILEKEGGILSVFPPGRAPVKQHFPERNRIVAGLSDLILVVEARQKSGTWITVDMALEQGKNVYAVPGRLTDRLSDGCNLLIRQGAGIALSPEDMLAELALLRNRRMQKQQNAFQKKADTCVYAEGKDSQSKDEGILRFLDYHAKAVDEILEDMHGAGINKELSEALDELICLCMDGRAKQIEGNCFVKKMCKGEEA